MFRNKRCQQNRVSQPLHESPYTKAVDENVSSKLYAKSSKQCLLYDGNQLLSFGPENERNDHDLIKHAISRTVIELLGFEIAFTFEILSLEGSCH